MERKGARDYFTCKNSRGRDGSAGGVNRLTPRERKLAWNKCYHSLQADNDGANEKRDAILFKVISFAHRELSLPL